MKIDVYTVLLTGATGYIGSAWRAGASKSVQNIQFLPGRIPEIDPRATLDGVDMVIHLAAQLQKPGDEGIHRKHQVWTTSLGHACLERGVRLIFVSSSSVYAGRNGELLSEKKTSVAGMSAYAKSKLAAEQTLQEFAQRGLQVCILRFGSVFGYADHMRFHGAVNAFVKQAIEQRHFDVWNTERDQVRPYTHIDDCVAAINFIIDRDLFNGEIYNVVSENARISTVIRLVQQQVPECRVRYIDHARMNDLSFGIDDRKIRAIGFQPHGSLAMGIAEIAAFVQSQLRRRTGE